ncbi:MAG: TolC family protein, partial [Spirosomataceae bacterium]
MKKLLLIINLLIVSELLVAQSPTLDTYVREGISSNLSLKEQSLQLEKAVNSIAIARSNLAPRITFAPTYSLAAGGRKLDFPIGDLLNPVYTTLNQLTQGGNFPQVENVNVQFAPNNFQETVVRFQYPIFNSDIKYNILIQEGLLQTEEAKRKALVYELRNNIRVAYYQYLQSLEGIEVLKNAQTLLDQFVNLNQKLVKNQVALKDVVLSAEYEVSKIKQQIATAEKNSKLAKSYVNFLINRELESEI